MIIVGIFIGPVGCVDGSLAINLDDLSGRPTHFARKEQHMYQATNTNH